MYNIGDLVVYQKKVCKIKDIKEKFINENDYYILEPVNDPSLKLNVPTNNKSIRNIITKEDVDNIIHNITSINTIDVDEKNIEYEYKKLLNNATHEDLIKIIKTTYLRNKDRIDNKRKISDKDKTYFDLAEKYLYTEFAAVLNMSYDDTKTYVIKEVKKELKNV